MASQVSKKIDGSIGIQKKWWQHRYPKNLMAPQVNPLHDSPRDLSPGINPWKMQGLRLASPGVGRDSDLQVPWKPGTYKNVSRLKSLKSLATHGHADMHTQPMHSPQRHKQPPSCTQTYYGNNTYIFSKNYASISLWWYFLQTSTDLHFPFGDVFSPSWPCWLIFAKNITRYPPKLGIYGS